MDTRALDEAGYDLEVVRQGSRVTDDDVDRAQRKVRAALRATPARLLSGRITLSHVPDPAVERPMRVSVALELDGSLVHVHADAQTMRDAIDVVEERTRRQLLDVRSRTRFRRRRTGIATEGEWRHGDRTEPT